MSDAAPTASASSTPGSGAPTSATADGSAPSSQPAKPGSPAAAPAATGEAAKPDVSAAARLLAQARKDRYDQQAERAAQLDKEAKDRAAKAEAGEPEEPKPDDKPAEAPKEPEKKDEPKPSETEALRARLKAEREQREHKAKADAAEARATSAEGKLKEAEPVLTAVSQARERLAAGDTLGAIRMAIGDFDPLALMTELGRLVGTAPDAPPKPEQPPEKPPTIEELRAKLREEDAKEAEARARDARTGYLGRCQAVLEATPDKFPLIDKADANEVSKRLDTFAGDFYKLNGYATTPENAMANVEVGLAIDALPGTWKAAADPVKHRGVVKLGIAESSLTSWAWEFAKVNQRPPTAREACDAFEEAYASAHREAYGGAAPAPVPNGLPAGAKSDPGRAPPGKETPDQRRERLARELDAAARRAS